jgi:hypothetical protein
VEFKYISRVVRLCFEFPFLIKAFEIWIPFKF